MPFFAQNGHEKRGSCSPTVNLKAVESYLKVGGYAPEYAVIREIEPGDDSNLIFDKLLPLMNVDFVKNGDLTVVPFPIKYLREWIKVDKGQ